jgi:hypothetical protein
MNNWWVWMEQSSGEGFILGFRISLAVILFLDFFYSFHKIRSGSNSFFAYCMISFTFVVALSFCIANSKKQSCFVMFLIIDAIIPLQSWIFAMGYLKSYLNS